LRISKENKIKKIAKVEKNSKKQEKKIPNLKEAEKRMISIKTEQINVTIICKVTLMTKKST
jgi:hypothetical protein